MCDLLVQQKTVARDPQTADGDVRTVSSYHGGRPSLSLCLRPKPKPKPKPNPNPNPNQSEFDGGDPRDNDGFERCWLVWEIKRERRGGGGVAQEAPPEPIPT